MFAFWTIDGMQYQFNAMRYPVVGNSKYRYQTHLDFRVAFVTATSEICILV